MGVSKDTSILSWELVLPPVICTMRMRAVGRRRSMSPSQLRTLAYSSSMVMVVMTDLGMILLPEDCLDSVLRERTRLMPRSRRLSSMVCSASCWVCMCSMAGCQERRKRRVSSVSDLKTVVWISAVARSFSAVMAALSASSASERVVATVLWIICAV